MKRVLIISCETEFYYLKPFVEATAELKEVDLVVFDTERFPSDSCLTLRMNPSGSVYGCVDVVRLNGNRFVPDTVAIESVQIAWSLRAKPPTPKRMDTSVDLNFSKKESALALRALEMTAPWRWINKRETIRLVEQNKFYQQKLASASGLLVPETMISNNHQSESNFADAEEGRLLLKTIGFPNALDIKSFCYSNIFSSRELKNSKASIQECPIFSQHYVEKKYEYRVMVIGERVLSCRIDSQASPKASVDWRRYDFDNVKHEAVSLPQEINESLIRFMRAVGLQYGAIDLIETPEGQFVFLEVNPSGQWGWIADLAELKIPEAVAKMLAEF